MSRYRCRDNEAVWTTRNSLVNARVVCNREDTLNYINFRAYVQTVLVQQFLSNDFVLTWEYSILFCLGIDRNSFLTNFCFKCFSIIF